jgi:hypothetical protein
MPWHHITPTNVTEESRRCDDATQLVLGVVQSLSPAQTPGGERSGIIVDAYCFVTFSVPFGRLSNRKRVLSSGCWDDASAEDVSCNMKVGGD